MPGGFLLAFSGPGPGDDADTVEGGVYVRRWCPELAKLPDDLIHRPWEAPESLLAKADVVLGRDYPRPIVDHQAARKKALEAFEQIKKFHQS